MSKWSICPYCKVNTAGIHEYGCPNRNETTTFILPQLDRVQVKYNELIMAVVLAFPGESRHETALRYIHEAESAGSVAGDAQSDRISAEESIEESRRNGQFGVGA